eukprot:IDg20779t1
MHLKATHAKREEYQNLSDSAAKAKYMTNIIPVQEILLAHDESNKLLSFCIDRSIVDVIVGVLLWTCISDSFFSYTVSRM